MTDETESRRRALAFNAVGPAINNAGYWLPLSARRAVAEAVLAAVADPDAGYCPYCGRGDCAPTADDYEQAQRRAIHIQTLLDEQRDRARKDAAASRASERILQQQIDAQAREIDRLRDADRRVRQLADQRFVAGPTPEHIQAGKELFAALQPPKGPSTPRHAIASAHEGDAATEPHGACTCGHTITGDTAPARLEAHIADAIQECADRIA